MRAIVYSQTGDTDVLSLVERPVPAPAAGEVLVRLQVAGVNPTDWRFRRGTGPGQPTPFPEVVPGQDGAGVVEALGDGVTDLAVGDRVWVYLAGWNRAQGTAEDYVALDRARVVALPDSASLELGAFLGVPVLTAHACLTAAQDGPKRLSPGALAGRVVLVAGGAGAVGNAAIQLAHWAGATVITTVSSPEKAELARRAGADHVVNYREQDAATAIRAIAPEGVHVIVEVAPTTNAALDVAVAAPHAVVSIYANEANPDMTLTVRPNMIVNLTYRFLMLYNVTAAERENAVAATIDAVAAGAIAVGEKAGMPLHRYPLEHTAAAHAAVESGVVGKVLLDLV